MKKPLLGSDQPFNPSMNAISEYVQAYLKLQGVTELASDIVV